MNYKFEDVCRLCLEFNKKSYDLFNGSYLKNGALCYYSELLYGCTKIRPLHFDRLPKKICKVCLKNLKKSYYFIKQCEENDGKLYTFLSEHLGRLDEDLTTKFKHFLNNDLNKEKNYVPSVEVPQQENLKIEINVDIKSEINDNSNAILDADDRWDEEDDDLLVDVKLKKKCYEDCITKEENGPYGENSDDKEELYDEHFLSDAGNNGEQINHSNRIDGNEQSASEYYVENSENQRNITKSKKKRGRKKIARNKDDPDGKTPHQCDVCGKIISSKSNLRAHKLCHTELRPYKCEDCSATFRGYSALFQHRRIHTGETPYHCNYCDKKFRRRTGLINHVRTHTGEKLYSCDICMKTFVQCSQLTIHMKRHKGEKTFLCQTCGKGFPIRSDLTVHTRTHNGEKPYPCHLCEKKFATRGNLSIHVRIHNKEVRYHCPVCQRGFVTCSSFNVHVKRHKGQRDYECDCGKTFYTSSALNQHRVVHTGEKKYQCKVCEKKFSQSSHLGRHFKKEHAKSNAPLPPPEEYKFVISRFSDTKVKAVS